MARRTLQPRNNKLRSHLLQFRKLYPRGAILTLKRRHRHRLVAYHMPNNLEGRKYRAGKLSI